MSVITMFSFGIVQVNSDIRSTGRNESDFTAAAPKASSPSAPRASSSSEGMNQTTSPYAPAASSPFTNQGSGHAPAGVSASTNNNDNGFDEFDPRGMASGNADCGFCKCSISNLPLLLM